MSDTEEVNEQETETETVKETITEPITKKDPKRVEQGKKLAAISKQAKEDKMRRKIREEEFSYFPYFMYTLAIVSSGGLMYFLLSSGKKNDLQPVTVTKVEQSPKADSPKVEKKSPPKKRFETLD